jgi:hypothetical protein
MPLHILMAKLRAMEQTTRVVQGGHFRREGKYGRKTYRRLGPSEPSPSPGYSVALLRPCATSRKVACSRLDEVADLYRTNSVALSPRANYTD